MALGGAVGREDDVHGAQGLFESGGGLEEGGIEEGELEGVEFGGDGAGAAEVEDAEFAVAAHEEVSGVGIGVEEV